MATVVCPYQRRGRSLRTGFFFSSLPLFSWSLHLFSFLLSDNVSFTLAVTGVEGNKKSRNPVRFLDGTHPSRHTYFHGHGPLQTIDKELSFHEAFTREPMDLPSVHIPTINPSPFSISLSLDNRDERAKEDAFSEEASFHSFLPSSFSSLSPNVRRFAFSSSSLLRNPPSSPSLFTSHSSNFNDWANPDSRHLSSSRSSFTFREENLPPREHSFAEKQNLRLDLPHGTQRLSLHSPRLSNKKTYETRSLLPEIYPVEVSVHPERGGRSFLNLSEKIHLGNDSMNQESLSSPGDEERENSSSSSMALPSMQEEEREEEVEEEKKIKNRLVTRDTSHDGQEKSVEKALRQSAEENLSSFDRDEEDVPDRFKRILIREVLKEKQGEKKKKEEKYAASHPPLRANEEEKKESPSRRHLSYHSSSAVHPSTSEEQERFVVPGNMTVSLYREELGKSIERVHQKYPGRPPVILFRWRSQEVFVDAASHIVNREGKPYFYIVAGEYAQTPIRRMGFFQRSSITSIGPIQWPVPPLPPPGVSPEESPGKPFQDQRQCPFYFPRPDQVLGGFSSVNITSSSVSSLSREEEEVKDSSHEEMSKMIIDKEKSQKRSMQKEKSHKPLGGADKHPPSISSSIEDEQKKERSAEGDQQAYRIEEKEGDEKEKGEKKARDAFELEKEEMMKEHLLLRWVPFGLTRKASTGETPAYIRREEEEGETVRREEEKRRKGIHSVRDFVHALRNSFPENLPPLETVDGREIVVIVNDRLPELDLLLLRAMKYAANGTPVIVTDTEAFAPDNILPRMRTRSLTGEKLLYVVFGFGRYGQLPLNTAFLDRSVLRIPKFTDIEAFIKRFADPPSTTSTSTSSSSPQSVSSPSTEKTHERHMSRVKKEDIERKVEKGIKTGEHEEKNPKREEKRNLSPSSASSSMATGKKKDSMREGFEGGSENMSEERTDTVEEEGERLKKQREGEESKTEESLDEKPQGEELLTNEDTMNEEDGGGAASVENPSFLESEEGIERQEIDFNSRNAQEGNEEEREMKMKRQEMSERDRKFEEDIDHHNFLILNPFNEFLMRFNYTEVDNITSYAEELTKELRDSPLTFQHKNETRRVVVVLLTEFPEAESLLFAGLMKLNVIVQSTIAVAMIIGLLACLCMCRMMFLLKSR